MAKKNFVRLDRKMIIANASSHDPDSVRNIYTSYTRIQKLRIMTNNQVKALQKYDRPSEILAWHLNNIHALEEEAARALKGFASKDVLAQWPAMVTGIGPVLTSGILGNFDMRRLTYVNDIWSRAGLDPNVTWYSSALVSKHLPEYRKLLEKYKRSSSVNFDNELFSEVVEFWSQMLDNANDYDVALRLRNVDLFDVTEVKNKLVVLPWNRALKRILWLVATSFVMNKSKDSCYYGHLYIVRKNLETYKNNNGEFSGLADKILQSKNITSKEYKETLKDGRLSASHIEMRVRRYVNKIFLSHFAVVSHYLLWGKNLGFPLNYNTLPINPKEGYAITVPDKDGNMVEKEIKPNYDGISPPDLELIFDILKKKYDLPLYPGYDPVSYRPIIAQEIEERNKIFDEVRKASKGPSDEDDGVEDEAGDYKDDDLDDEEEK